MAQLGAYIALISVALIGLTYGLYPAVRLMRLHRSKQGPQDPDFQPEVSIIFAAYNEKEVIEEKIHSIYATDYDATNVSVFIGSDQSNDGTDEIITTLQSKYHYLSIWRFSGLADPETFRTKGLLVACRPKCAE